MLQKVILDLDAKVLYNIYLIDRNKGNKMSATNYRRVTVTAHINSQEAGDSAVSNRKYVVGSIDNLGNFSVSENPAVHTSSMTAAAECDRLAGLNPGKTFVFMQLCGGRRVPTSRVVL